MSSVWMVQYDCGDYYCEGVHPLGVFSTEALADGAVTHWMAHPKRTISESAWSAEWTIDEAEEDSP